MRSRETLIIAALAAFSLPALSAAAAGLLGISLNVWNLTYALTLSTAVFLAIWGGEFTGIAVCVVLYFNSTVGELVSRIAGKSLSPIWDEPIVIAINIYSFYFLSRIRFPFESDTHSPTPYWLWWIFYLYTILLPVFIFMPRSPLAEWVMTNVALYYATLSVIFAAAARIFPIPLPPWHESKRRPRDCERRFLGFLQPI